MPKVENKDNNNSITKEIRAFIKEKLKLLVEWLSPNPNDHWSVQILKSVAKLPLVLLLIICSPVLLVILSLVFLIAI